MAPSRGAKLHGRAFYESLGSPRLILAPMVDRSEYAWRLLTRSYLDEEGSTSYLAYTPMIHARLFGETARYRDEHFQPKRSSLTSKDMSNEPAWLDGNPANDRPLFVQFCANRADELLEAAEYVAPYCDAVDLNLGCPQGIARSGHYGAFLQEDWESISRMVSKLHHELSIPVTAKMRILDTREKTLEYAKMILSAGASIITVHGRRRDQKGHNMGLADWAVIRYLRDNLPNDTVLFANGNILSHGDLRACLEATGADGVMSAEGNLSDPTIFAGPPTTTDSREYWSDRDGIGGYRVDGVVRRYLDIIHRFVLEQEPPDRPPLYLPGDPDTFSQRTTTNTNSSICDESKLSGRRGRRDNIALSSPNIRVIQGHLFQILKNMIHIRTDIRDVLAKTRTGDVTGYENVLLMLENAVKEALDEEDAGRTSSEASPSSTSHAEPTDGEDVTSRYRRPWWICQPFIRPLREETVGKGAAKPAREIDPDSRKSSAIRNGENSGQTGDMRFRPQNAKELPKEALVCG